MNKIKQNKLLKYAEDKLKSFGFVEGKNKRYNYYKQTFVGELGITFRTDREGLNVFAMFNDPQKAIKNHFPCGFYTGKYNYYSLEDKQEIDYVLGLYPIN